MTARGSALPWVVAGIATATAWLLGLAVFSEPYPADYLVIPFAPMNDLVEPAALMGTAGLGVGVATGLLGRRLYPRLALVVGFGLFAAYRAFTSSFAGFCIDPGEDACVLTTSASWSGLAANVAGIVVAGVVDLTVRRVRIRS